MNREQKLVNKYYHDSQDNLTRTFHKQGLMNDAKNMKLLIKILKIQREFSEQFINSMTEEMSVERSL